MNFLELKRDPMKEQNFKESYISKQPKFPLKIQLIRNVIACHKRFPTQASPKSRFFEEKFRTKIQQCCVEELNSGCNQE